MTELTDSSHDNLSPATGECVSFQAQMPDRIGAGENLLDNPHLVTCERCRALVEDLQYIAGLVKDLMPIEIEPRDAVWNELEKRLALEQEDLTPFDEESAKLDPSLKTGNAPLAGTA